MNDVLQKTPSTILQLGIKSSWVLHVAELLRRQLHVPQKAKLVRADYVLTTIEQFNSRKWYLSWFQMKHGILIFLLVWWKIHHISMHFFLEGIIIVIPSTIQYHLLLQIENSVFIFDIHMKTTFESSLNFNCYKYTWPIKHWKLPPQMVLIKEHFPDSSFGKTLYVQSNL